MVSKIRKLVSPTRFHGPNAFRICNGLFNASYTPKHNPSFACRQVLADKLHPLHDRSLSRFLDLPRNMLWVYVSTNTLSNIAVRRVALRRMIKAVLSEALRDAGFDLNAILWGGHRVQMRKRLNQYSRVTFQGGVTGTLDITAQKELADAERGKVKLHIGFIVEKLKSVTREKSVETGVVQPERAQYKKSKRTFDGSIGRRVTLNPKPLSSLRTGVLDGVKFGGFPIATV